MSVAAYLRAPSTRFPFTKPPAIVMPNGLMRLRLASAKVRAHHLIRTCVASLSPPHRDFCNPPPRRTKRTFLTTRRLSLSSQSHLHLVFAGLNYSCLCLQ
jgi:hypothetical protein